MYSYFSRHLIMTTQIIMNQDIIHYILEDILLLYYYYKLIHILI